MALTANLLDAVQAVLASNSTMTLIEIHAALNGKYSEPQVHEALMYLMRGDSLGKAARSGTQYRLLRRA
jgi:hypothetical protein